MKTLLWILGLIGFFALVVWGVRKYFAWVNKDNAWDDDEKAANVQAAAKGAQAAASYGTILPPSATFVRPNGALIDLNLLGGSIPDLYTLPRWSPVIAPNG